MAQQDSQTLNEEQTNKLTVWALASPSFTLDMLTGQIQRMRNFSADSIEVAKELIQQWKRQGKVKFVRGYWKWQF